MTATVIRERLITMLADADDKKVKEYYSLLKGHINIEAVPDSFSVEQLAVLNERRESFLNGTEPGMDWQTIHENVRNRRNAAR